MSVELGRAADGVAGEPVVVEFAQESADIGNWIQHGVDAEDPTAIAGARADARRPQR